MKKPRHKIVNVNLTKLANGFTVVTSKGYSVSFIFIKPNGDPVLNTSQKLRYHFPHLYKDFFSDRCIDLELLIGKYIYGVPKEELLHYPSAGSYLYRTLR